MKKLTPTDTFLLHALLPTPSNQQAIYNLLSGSALEINWSAIASRSVLYGTSALLRYNLVSANAVTLLPAAIRQILEKESHTVAAKHLLYVTAAQRLMTALRAHGINSLPLKGAALMLGNYYPQPGLRTAVDLDVLIEPAQADQAFAVALTQGYAAVALPPGKAPLPIPHERRHLPVLRGAHGVLLELHFRAFHDPATRCDFGFAEMMRRAVKHNDFLLPAAEDLALHAIQHSIVDLTSAPSILRTLADVYFLLEKTPQARQKLWERAQEWQLQSAVALALKALDGLMSGDFVCVDPDVELLLTTALMASMERVVTAARLAEYLDLRHQPWQKINHLFSLMNAGSEKAKADELTGSVWHRSHALFRRFNWRGISLRDLRRVMRLRKLTRKK